MPSNRRVMYTAFFTKAQGPNAHLHMRFLSKAFKEKNHLLVVLPFQVLIVFVSSGTTVCHCQPTLRVQESRLILRLKDHTRLDDVFVFSNLRNLLDRPRWLKISTGTRPRRTGLQPLEVSPSSQLVHVGPQPQVIIEY